MTLKVVDFVTGAGVKPRVGTLFQRIVDAIDEYAKQEAERGVTTAEVVGTLEFVKSYVMEGYVEENDDDEIA